MLAGHEITAAPSLHNASDNFFRRRGERGRGEAVERGVVTGDGPSGGITGSGKSVVLYGLPGKMTEEGVSFFVRSFKLAGMAPKKEKDIVKLDA